MKKFLLALALVAASTPAWASVISRTANTLCVAVSAPEVLRCFGPHGKAIHMVLCVDVVDGDINGFLLNRRGASLCNVNGVASIDGFGRLCLSMQSSCETVFSGCTGEPELDHALSCLGLSL